MRINKLFNKKKFAKVIALSAVAAMMVTSSGNVSLYADTKSEAESKKAAAAAEKESLNKEIDELNSLKADTQAYIHKIDSQMTDVSTKIQKLKQQCSEKKEAISKSKTELAAAEKTEKKQYADMKLRIQFMYENGNYEYASLLLSASSISDFLNKAEYISKITDYDQKMLDEYVKTKEKIASTKKQLEEDYAKLKSYEEEQEAKQESLQTLYDKKSKDLAKIRKSVSGKKAKAAQADADFENADNILKDIAAQEAAQREAASKRAAQEEASRQEAARQAAAAQQTKARSYSNNSGSSSNSSPSSSSSSSASNSSGGSSTASGGYVWPLPSAYHSMSTEFGVSDAFGNAGHCGVDYPAPAGTPIYAVNSGRVVFATYTSSTGNCVEIDHGNGLLSIYMHLSAYGCSVGQTVSKGQVIGYVGTTGPSTGNHLHISFRQNGTWLNPHNYIGY